MHVVDTQLTQFCSHLVRAIEGSGYWLCCTFLKEWVLQSPPFSFLMGDHSCKIAVTIRLPTWVLNVRKEKPCIDLDFQKVSEEYKQIASHVNSMHVMVGSNTRRRGNLTRASLMFENVIGCHDNLSEAYIFFFFLQYFIVSAIEVIK